MLCYTLAEITAYGKQSEQMIGNSVLQIPICFIFDGKVITKSSMNENDVKKFSKVVVWRYEYRIRYPTDQHCTGTMNYSTVRGKGSV